MTLLRNLAIDLVEKKLWPIAVALLVAVVAIPVAIGKVGGDEPAAAGVGARAAVAPEVPPSRAVVSLEEPADAAAPGDRSGSKRNPFKQLHVPKAPSLQATLPTGPTGGAIPSTSTPSAGTGAGNLPPVSGGDFKPGPAPSKPEVDLLDIYRVDLRFGEAGNLRLRENVARLTPLPSIDDPFFVFLGVLEDGKTAVFLVSSDIKATGDGKCRPSSRSCETIELRKGDTEFFDVTRGDDVTQFQLDLRDIEKREVKTTAAIKAYTRHSKVGSAYVQTVGESAEGSAARGYRYLPRKGVLVRAKRKARARGAAASGRPRPLLSWREQPGRAVWRTATTG